MAKNDLKRWGGVFLYVLILMGCKDYCVEDRLIKYDGHIFRVLSPRLIAVQEEGRVHGHYNYAMGACAFEVHQNGRILEISTEKCRVIYSPGEGPVTDRIQVQFSGINGDVTAVINQKDKQNLGGIIRSVDRCDGRLEYSAYDTHSPARALAIPNGLLSQRGFTVLKTVDGALKHLEAEGKAQELFVFCYGMDYKSALKDLTTLNGKVPLLPQWTLGTWFSRYQPLTADDYKQIVKHFRKEQIPIDVIVPDMNWHIDGWFGTRYDLDKFPDMKGFLKWTEANGLHIGFNHHPGAVIRDDERAHLFCEKAGLNYDSLLLATQQQYEDSKWEFIENALFYGEGNPAHIQPFFDVFLAPMMDDGLDFHWVDGGPSLVNLKAYYELTEQHTDKRAIVLTRQVPGSFDHHRYPIGFSADSYISWESLKFNTELTIMGANNGVYWSHDIGGHMERYPGMDNKELFTRWVQSGALSPFCRLHATGGVEWDQRLVHCRQPWKWGKEVLNATRDILQLKYKLMPYTYTLNRMAYDEGLLICHGMYMDYPAYANAYQYGDSQYMYGPSLLVAPITEAAPDGQGLKGRGVKNVWLPEGTWYDYFTGERFEGPLETVVSKPLNEMPLFVKEGAILPLSPYMEFTGQKPMDELFIEFYQPTHTMHSSFRMYEDDGETLVYKDGQCRWTTIDYQYDTAKGTEITIHPVEGHYEGDVNARRYVLMIKYPGARPEQIKLNGKVLSADAYSLTGAVLEIRTQQIPVSETVTLQVL